jgi:hypothetical protein
MLGAANPPYRRRFVESANWRAGRWQASFSTGIQEIEAESGGLPQRWQIKWQPLFQRQRLLYELLQLAAQA